MTTHRHTPECTIPHGTWRCYIDHACRRPECREAWRIYGADRNREIAYGRREVAHRVTGDLARWRIEQLIEQGMKLQEIARHSGVTPVTITRIRHGQGTTTCTQEAILRVEAEVELARDDMPDRALVDGAGTRRRLQALTARGWTCTKLAEHCSSSPQALRTAMLKSVGASTLAGFARSVTDLYEQLWDQTPQCRNGHERARAVRVREDAVERGWAPPMAWDEESIDNPKAEPAPWREVTDLGTARRKIHLDDLEDCVRWGFDLRAAAERLAVTTDAITVCAKRADRPDLLKQLHHNSIALHHVA